MACESSNSSITKDWSFGSASSSSNNSSTHSFLSPGHNYQCIATLKTQNHNHITCLARHKNLLYAASGNEINVFDLTTLSPINAFDGRDLHSGGFIKSMAFHDQKIITAHQDSKIRVWEGLSKRHRLVTTLPTLKDRFSRSFCPTNYVQVRRHKKKLWIEHNDAVSGLAVHNGLIYSVSWDKTLKFWRTSDLKCAGSVTAHEDAVNSIAVSVNGTVYTGSADGRIRVWERSRDTEDKKVGRHSMVATLDKHGSSINALALTRDGKVLISGGSDGLIMAWERDDCNQTVGSGVVGGHDGAVLCLIILDDRDLIVSGSADRTIRIWGKGDGEDHSFFCLAVMEGHNKPVRSLAVAPSGSPSTGVVSMYSGSLDGEIKIWQIMVSELINISSSQELHGKSLDLHN